ncbi:MAG: glycosyltransferase family 2 protein, partial [Prolixibacteraceae bacterium]|nr:glycosyltransferase family 2 protein [Prolixibacteraceae bacterium]
MDAVNELSIIILCYRAEEEIIPFAKKVKKIAQTLSDNFEIILVGNYIEGSSDRTKEVVERIASEDNTFRTVCKPKKGMMGWDMREGLMLADGKYLCVIDGDGQFPIESIIKCFEIIKTNQFGLVKTYRKLREDGIYRKFISQIYNWSFSMLFPRVKSKDVNSKPKIITREVYEKLGLTSDDWFIDAEIMINISKLGVKYYEFPINFYKL